MTEHDFPRAEQIVAIGGYLEQRGLTVEHLDWTCPEGTADLIARDGTTLIAVAVAESPADVSEGPRRSRLEMLRRVAAAWAQEHAPDATEIRVDVYRNFRDEDGFRAMDATTSVGGTIPLAA